MYNNKQINFQKCADGLVPAIVQDSATLKVLMLGYMNQEALDKTLQEGKVTFFSRSKQRLWTKGEESGNFLSLQEIRVDCDSDTLLIKAIPAGVVCHTGADTCWEESNVSNDFLAKLESIIVDRKNNPSDDSYTSKLFAKGINKVAQKVGEEAVEVVIEAKDDNEELFLNESADLLFHYLVLLHAKGYQLADVLSVLQKRHSK
ncbi:bifunctional phosphoribosyl-AMP cyclohydrolase/phosphoribosyl-ATP diphosphatase HisIE [Chitinophaga agri]|uniref:Histidine biosynthesis bifunctional protein HisIE n=1 Tax=Chitinophaga agri TaxID=2703787 RepID=A0A6B9ZJN3_9BACT|nr:bifunctional phosphoribosyl-AMP cyclohydrolase/phosphoribosyl-ATP diphosphatase HisIE [Chitinophaga agri]QHS62640.1 bifunctional phosphoribosyl-AMP cyclohydrolase/phosphoribosyl-ATP diphosphatase HisIE [Chitinophaga agri]